MAADASELWSFCSWRQCFLWTAWYKVCFVAVALQESLWVTWTPQPALASAGSTTSQNGKGATQLGPDRITEIRSQFKTFLSEASGFYHDMLKIRAKCGLSLGHDQENQLLSQDGNISAEMKRGLISYHRCLIYLVDLARYKGLYGEAESKARDFAATSSYYMQASSLWPSSGNPHHQVSLLNPCC